MYWGSKVKKGSIQSDYQIMFSKGLWSYWCSLSTREFGMKILLVVDILWIPEFATSTLFGAIFGLYWEVKTYIYWNSNLNILLMMQVMIYDLRSSLPIRVKDHMWDFSWLSRWSICAPFSVLPQFEMIIFFIFLNNKNKRLCSYAGMAVQYWILNGIVLWILKTQNWFLLITMLSEFGTRRRYELYPWEAMLLTFSFPYFFCIWCKSFRNSDESLWELWLSKLLHDFFFI